MTRPYRAARLSLTFLAALVSGCGGSLEPADITLDPERPPDPAQSELHLLVTETECASGQLATGRIRVADLVETSEAVEVTIGVERVRGGADCPSNPPTPFTVELDEPIGEREVVLSSVDPVTAP